MQAGLYSRWKGGNDQVSEQLEPRGVGLGFTLTPSNGFRRRKCHMRAQSPSKVTDC